MGHEPSWRGGRRGTRGREDIIFLRDATWVVYYVDHVHANIGPIGPIFVLRMIYKLFLEISGTGPNYEDALLRLCRNCCRNRFAISTTTLVRTGRRRNL